jgi:preprotein translocase subunit SecA
VVDIPTNKPVRRDDKNDLIFQNEKGKFKAIAKSVKDLNSKGQPVLIGTVSIEKNELLSSYLTQEGVQHTILNAKPQYAEREGEIVAQAGKKGAVTIATNMAGRGVDIKLGGALATPAEHEEVKNLGGLFVLGTERHEARRIDNQLRGRSGRQGDPGATQFFVSLEDSLMRVFASDMIKKMMGRLNIPEDEPIENSLITRSLESAQKKIEGFNFDSRKHVLEYDDVLSLQRKSVYDRRRRILLGDHEAIDHELTALIAGDEEMQKIVEGKKAAMGDQEFYAVIRRLFLQTIDMLWVEHLELMEYTRGSVNLRAYGQRDPLVEYKKEGLRLFREMQEAMNAQILSMLPNIGGGAFAAAEIELKNVQKQAVELGGSDMASGAPEGAVTVSVSNAPKNADGEKVGRNDDCPCGSGKKWKKCGELNTEEHQRLMSAKKQ